VTLAAVTGREAVPPNPGAMGAGHRSVRDRRTGADALAAAPGFDLELVLGAEVVGRTSSGRTAAAQRQMRARVAVLGGEQTVLSGGACPKYEVASGAREAPEGGASAFDERQALLAWVSRGAPA
jgi:hypothetical protein